MLSYFDQVMQQRFLPSGRVQYFPMCGIVPRDPWLVDRRNFQPGDEFFLASFGRVTRQFEALAAAGSVGELFERLEAGGDLLRLDERVRPSVYRCATVTRAELLALRRLEDVVRLGHVRAVERDRIVLERDSVALAPGALVVDCSASGIPQRPPRPVFDGRLVTLQMVRTCQPTFSAAFIGHVEATVADEAEKNALCAAIPPPSVETD